MHYVQRCIDKHLAMKVAEQLSAHDQLGAHLRVTLGGAGAMAVTAAIGRLLGVFVG
jgi:hypothetical protein